MQDEPDNVPPGSYSLRRAETEVQEVRHWLIKPEIPGFRRLQKRSWGLLGTAGYKRAVVSPAQTNMNNTPYATADNFWKCLNVAS